MALELGQFEVMAYLWDTTDKADGENICYTSQDIDLLWQMGFVDTASISIEAWRQLFVPYKQSNGTFLINQENFLALDKYRYKGEIHIPFDANLINEGLYTEEGLNELFWQSIYPSSALNKIQLSEFIGEFIKEFREKDGLIRVDQTSKSRVLYLIDNYPSPLRNLEILFDQLFQNTNLDDGMPTEQMKTQVAEHALKQRSQFQTRPGNKTEEKAVELKDLVKAKPKTSAINNKKDPGVELKKIRRSRKGLRG